MNKKLIALAAILLSALGIFSQASISAEIVDENRTGLHQQAAKFGFHLAGWERVEGLEVMGEAALRQLPPSLRLDSSFDARKKQRVFLLLKQLKVNWVRLPFDWTSIEPQKGRFNFTTQDRIINEFCKNDINLLLTVGGSPEWAVRDYVKTSAIPPDDPNDYVNFLVKAVERYKNKVKAWEIWNEPDNPPYWGMKKSTPQQYMELLKPAYAAIKRVAPDAVVVGACTLLQYKREPDYSYLRGLLNLGLLNYCDAVSVHIYPPQGPQAIDEFNKCLETVENIVREYGKNEIWVTEVGMNSKQFSKQKLEELLMEKGLGFGQLKALVKIPIFKLAFIPLTNWQIYKAKLKHKEEIERALSPFGLTFTDALELPEQSYVDAQEKQAEFAEKVYLASKKHRMFWFELYDLYVSMGIVDKDLNPKSAYDRLLSFI